MKLKDAYSLEEKLWPTYKGPSSQSYGFSSSHVWKWELDHKESWTPKNWCFWTVALEKTLESPLDSKEIIPVNPKGNQFWIFIGKTDAEAEAPVLWPRDAKSQLTGKDPDPMKDEGRRVAEMKCLDSITDSMDTNLSKFWEIAKDREAWCGAVHGATNSSTWVSHWTTKLQIIQILESTLQLVRYTDRCSHCSYDVTTEFLKPQTCKALRFHIRIEPQFCFVLFFSHSLLWYSYGAKLLGK